MSEANEDILVIDPKAMNLDRCCEVIQDLLDAVNVAARDYFNTTPVLTLHDALDLGNDIELSWSIPIDLKAFAVVSALAQAPIALRGDTDRGKTALSERVLSGLFGRHGDGWRRMEINRGLTVDDLVDIDVEKLSKLTVTEAMSAAKWLGKPARLLDEINRAHPKLLNLVLHLVDGSGFNIRGDLFVPVGLPYRVGDQEKRYSFCIVTANPPDPDFAGVFDEDSALTRRIVVSVDLDELTPASRDVAMMMATRRAKATLPETRPHTEQVITVYEALPRLLSFSALGELFPHYLAAMNTCVRTRSGRIKPQLKPAICDGCHLSKATRYCGRVGALGEGLLLWVKELSTAISAVRACMVLKQTHENCLESGQNSSHRAKLQLALGVNGTGEDLYDHFRRVYLERLRVTGEDVKAAFALIAPEHVWIDRDWLKGRTDCESNPLYVFRETANDAWNSMVRFLKEHRDLASRIAGSAVLSPGDQEEIEEFVTTRDASMLGVINALRDVDVPLHVRAELKERREIQAT